MTVRSIPLAVCVVVGILAVTGFLTAIRYVGAARGDVGSAGSAAAVAAPPLEARSQTPPQPAPSAAALPNPASDPGAALDEVRAARKLGWPVAVGAIVTMLALALGTAGSRVPWLAWLGRGAAATVLGVVTACGSSAYDAAIGGGSWMAMATAAAASLIAFWRAHRPPAPALEVARAIDRATQRGSISGLLALVLSGAAVVGLAFGVWSCSGTQRRAVIAGAVDCTIGVLAEHSAALKPLAKDAILAGHWDELGAAAKALGIEDGGCAIAAALSELLAPPAAGVAEQALIAAPRPEPEQLRAGWERLRSEALGGRHYAVSGAVL